MLGRGRDGVKLGFLLEAAATLHPPRAASVRRFAACALKGLPREATLEALRHRREEWLAEPPPASGAAALRRLVAEDLGPLLEAAPAVAERIAAWEDPETALRLALAAESAALEDLGIEVGAPHLHLVDRIPPPYDHPALAGVNIGQGEQRELGLAPGILLDRRRLAPLVSEATLGHLLIHAALEKRSPERLGRGLEEGIAEVLGALLAAQHVVGADGADLAFLARRRTASSSPHREVFLAQVRAAALLVRRQGIGGLVALVRQGRDAVKQAEAALTRGRLADVALPPAPPTNSEPSADGQLATTVLVDRLDRCLLARGPLLAVTPLAFHLAPALAQSGSAARAARETGVPADLALAAARELMERPFVLVLSGRGDVLVDDVALVLGSGALHYETG